MHPIITEALAPFAPKPDANREAIAEEQAAVDSAYDAGRKSYATGETLHANPFNDDLNGEWNRGWLDAQLAARKAAERNEPCAKNLAEAVAVLNASAIALLQALDAWKREGSRS